MIRIRGSVTARRLLPAVVALLALTGVLVWEVMRAWPPVSGMTRVEPSSPVAAASETGTGLSLPDHSRTAPPLHFVHFVDGKGRATTLVDFRGRAVLLNLWATWCVPCREEMPTLDRLQARLGGPDFEVVALSIDRKGLSVVAPFYRQLGLKALGIYIDESGEAASDLGSVGIPTTLLIDKAGREIARKLGPAEWDSPQMTALIRRYLPSGADAGKKVGP